MPVLSPLSQIKIASFILIVKDQNCQFYLKCHRSRLPALSILSQMKNVRFVYINCWGSKLPVLSSPRCTPCVAKSVMWNTPFELIFANSWSKSANCRPKLTITNLKMPNLSFILPIPGQNVPIVGQK